MTESVRHDVEQRLERYLASCVGYAAPAYINSGGSAAIFRVETPSGARAIKVYDPVFLQGSRAKAEKKRLDLQRSLIGHACPTLVEVFRVEEAEGTAFIEMEFVEWPQLRTVLAEVPDESVSTLIGQLVDAVKHLEKLEIVHRDIKPENIHVSPDFARLKLIDLGVARELIHPEEESATATDHGSKRPFIATAQYSSPEYLFRLDAPSALLWKGLSLYQVGAVLHDMINKRPLFQSEVDLDNRWLIARAVMAQVPTFPDADPTRLAAQKALSARCLVKDLNTRLAIVDWDDFSFEATTNSLDALKARLTKVQGTAGVQAGAASNARLEFERTAFAKRFCEAIRVELIAACGNKVPFALIATNSPNLYQLEFDAALEIRVVAGVAFQWMGEMQSRSAKIEVSCVLLVGQEPCAGPIGTLLAIGTIGDAEDVVAHDVACRVADCLTKGLDMLDSGTERAALHGADLGKLVLQKD